MLAFKSSSEEKESDSSGLSEIKATQQIRLLHVTSSPITQWLFLRGQNQFMADNKFCVHCASSPDQLLYSLSKRDPVVIHPIRISRSITPLGDLMSLFKLINIMIKVKPSIAHLSTPKAALLGAIASRLTQVPIRIFHIRGLSSEHAKGFDRVFFCYLERLTHNLCNFSVGNSYSLLNYARSAQVLSSLEGTVPAFGMANGVDTEGRYNPDQTADLDLAFHYPQLSNLSQPFLVIGFVGRLAKDKGIEELAVAWKNLREDLPNTVLLVIGPWEVEDSVNTQIRRELEEDPRVLLPGLLFELSTHFKAMDIFVYPSHGGEGFPNSPMEAAAMELPVITTPVVGCSESIEEGKTGLFVPPRDSESLERAIRIYLSDQKLRKTHGVAGRKRVKKYFQNHIIWNAWYNFYTQLLEKEGLHSPRESSRMFHALAKGKDS